MSSVFVVRDFSVFNILEQVAMAALDCNEADLFKVYIFLLFSKPQLCLTKLKNEFPKSVRVRLLEGADLESRGLYPIHDAIAYSTQMGDCR